MHRYAARLYCLSRYGVARAHAEEWWPSLVLSRPENGREGSITYRGRAMAPLHAYPAPLGGKGELVIVGSGPSLARQALESIPLRSALLLNGAVHVLEGRAVRPFAVVVEDERFVWRHWQTLARTVPAGTDCYFSTSVIRALCETAPEWLASQNVRHLDFVHRPYGALKRDRRALLQLPFMRWAEDRRTAISTVPGAGVVSAGSVAVTAMQIALALKPARIGLAGIDLTDTTGPRFYETADDVAMSRLDAARTKILAAFRLAVEEAGRQGIPVENYSPVSLLADVGIPYSPRLAR